MKVYRILYWIVLLGALGYGLYSGSRFCWLLFLVQGLTLLLSLGSNLWTYFSFSYLQKISAEQGEKGQTVALGIGIYNDKPFPFTRMRVKVEAPDPAENERLEINLAPKADCSFDLKLSLTRRGEYRVGMTRLDVQDVFGLLPMHFDLRHLPYYRQKNLLVLPRVLKTALPSGEGGALFSGRTTNAGQEEFSSLRDWQPGDSFSRIHWKASAKTRTLMTRRYEDSTGETCLIFLDCRAASDEAADRLCECAATLASAHLTRGDRVDLRCSSPSVKMPERAFSPSALLSLQQWLAVLPFDRKKEELPAVFEALKSALYSRVYVLGGRADPELAGLLEETWDVCRYWVAEPLDSDLFGDKVISLEQKDLAEWISRMAVMP